ncbi:MAG: uroporphyrinogen-III synthase [Chloroflexota bacterium]
MPSDSLRSKRIIVTRSAEQADALIERLEALGAMVIPFPVIQVLPLPSAEIDEAIAHLDRYDWLVFTSANAVRFFWERLSGVMPYLDRTRVAASGSATGDRLRALGVEPDFIPAEFVGERLVEGLGDVAGRRVLLPRSRIGRPEITELLRQRGAIVDDIALYDTVTAVPDEAAWAVLDRPVDCVTFTSPSSVRNWLKLIEGRGLDSRLANQEIAVACIGPITAVEAEKRGLSVALVPNEYTIDGLVKAITGYYAKRKDHVGIPTVE